MLLHLAAVLGFGAIASAVLGRRPGTGGSRVPVPLALAIPVVAVMGAVAAMALIPEEWLPLAMAAPLAGFFGVLGTVTLAAVRLTGRTAVFRRDRRTAVAAVVLTLLTVASFAVPAQLGWAHALPVGPRSWALIPITACAVAFFGGVEALCHGHGRVAATLIHAWTAAGALAGLCAAVLLGAASSFVLLVAPLLAALLAWQGVQAVALRGLRAPAWLTATVGGALLAWPIAVILPIT
jgi:hypothetical protein